MCRKVLLVVAAFALVTCFGFTDARACNPVGFQSFGVQSFGCVPQQQVFVQSTPLFVQQAHPIFVQSIHQRPIVVQQRANRGRSVQVQVNRSRSRGR